MINLLIADDHLLVAHGFSALLSSQPDMEVVTCVGNGLEALEAAGMKSIDIAILDLEMPEMGGLEAAREIKRSFPKVKVIILTMHKNEELVEKMLALGVEGYLLKNCESSECIKAVRSVAAGSMYYTAAISDILVVSKKHRIDQVSSFEKLSRREVDILKLIAEGYSTPEIARKLFIATGTVDTHRKNLLTKTGSRNSIHLIRYALDHGVIE